MNGLMPLKPSCELRLCFWLCLDTRCLSIMSVMHADWLHCCYRDCAFCCRLEAPRYRRVSPANGEPQRLIITKEVGGNIHNSLQTHCAWPGFGL